MTQPVEELEYEAFKQGPSRSQVLHRNIECVQIINYLLPVKLIGTGISVMILASKL